MAGRGRAAGRQLDIFNDLPDGRLGLLLAVLEREALKASARGRRRDAVRGLAVLRDELDGVCAGGRRGSRPGAGRAGHGPGSATGCGGR